MTPEQERDSLSEEELDLITLYARMLRKKSGEDRVYASNSRMFTNWSPYQRLKWIYFLEEQAHLGLPLAVELVSAAIAMKVSR